MKGKKANLTILLTFFLGILALLQVFVVNRYSTSGEQLTSYGQKSAVIEKENSRLRQKIASAEAMFSLNVRAQQLGLVKSSAVVSLTRELPVAYDLHLSL